MVLSENIGELDVSGNYDISTTIGELLTDGGGTLNNGFGYCDENQITVEDEDIEKVKDKTLGLSKSVVVKLIQKTKANIIDEELKHHIATGFIYELTEMLDYGYKNIEVFFTNEAENKMVSVNDVMGNNGNGTKGGYIPFKKFMGRIVLDKNSERLPEKEVMSFNKLIACFDHRKLEFVEHHYYSRNDPDVDFRTMSKENYLDTLFEEFFPKIHVDEMFGYDYLDNEIEESIENLSFNEKWIEDFGNEVEKYNEKNPIKQDEKRVQLKLVA